MRGGNTFRNRRSETYLRLYVSVYYSTEILCTHVHQNNYKTVSKIRKTYAWYLTLVQITACDVFSTKLLNYYLRQCWLIDNKNLWGRTSVKFEAKDNNFHPGKLIAKCRMQQSGDVTKICVCVKYITKIMKTVPAIFVKHSPTVIA